MYAIVETGSDSVSEANPRVELFRSEIVARLALARKFAKLMREYHTTNNIPLNGKTAYLLKCLESFTISMATSTRFWRTVEMSMNAWHENYRTDEDWYTTFWIVKVESGKNPLAPARLPGLDTR